MNRADSSSSSRLTLPGSIPVRSATPRMLAHHASQREDPYVRIGRLRITDKEVRTERDRLRVAVAVGTSGTQRQ